MYFLLNDDATIESIVSGSFTGTPDGHSIYFRYPLSGIVSLLYRIIPVIPWFTLVLLGCYIFAGAVLGRLAYKYLLKGETKKPGLFALVLSVMAFLCVPELIGLHYTVAAAALAGGAILWTVLEEKKQWIPAVALALTYCVRREVFLLAIPFWGVALLWRLPKKQYKVLLSNVLVTLCLSLAFMGINAFFYRGQEWKSFTEYNDARTELYDYAWYKVYDGNESAYEKYGMTRRDYELVSHYATAMDSTVDTEYFETMIQVSKEGEWVDTPLHTLKRMMVQYRNWILGTEEPFSLIMIGMYVLLIGLLVWTKQWYQAVLVALLGLGRSAVWIYLFWKGRFPERVQMALFVIEGSLLLGFLLEKLKEERIKEKTWQVVAGVVAAGFVCGTLALSAVSFEKQITQGKLQQDYKPLASYMEAHSQDLFIVDVKSVGNLYTQSIFDAGSEQSNALLAGGWVTGSPLMQERMEQLGVKDLGEALLGKENVYFVIDREEEYGWLESILGESVSEVEKIGKFLVLKW